MDSPGVTLLARNCTCIAQYWLFPGIDSNLLNKKKTSLPLKSTEDK